MRACSHGLGDSERRHLCQKPRLSSEKKKLAAVASLLYRAAFYMEKNRLARTCHCFCRFSARHHSRA